MVRGFDHNRLVMSAPFCSAKRKKRASGLPKFLFVAGVEGSGHHALKEVWAALAAHVPVELIVYDQLFHSLGIENHASYHYSSVIPEKHFESMKATFQAAKEKGAIVIDAQNSFPMGKGAGSLAHPDLLMLNELDGVLFDLRVVVLYRNPVSAVLSAVRRFRDNGEYKYKNAEFQARMVVESLVNINNAMQQLQCGHYMVMRFEDLVAKPEDFVGPLGRLLGVPGSHLRGALTDMIKPPSSSHNKTQAELDEKRTLEAFFEVQSSLWPQLA